MATTNQFIIGKSQHVLSRECLSWYRNRSSLIFDINIQFWHFFFSSDPFCFQRLLFSLSNEIFLAGLSRLKYQQIYQFKFKKLPLMFTRYKQDKKTMFNIQYSLWNTQKLETKCLYIYIYIVRFKLHNITLPNNLLLNS